MYHDLSYLTGKISLKINFKCFRLPKYFFILLKERLKESNYIFNFTHNAPFRVPKPKFRFGYPRRLSGTRLPQIPDTALADRYDDLRVVYMTILFVFVKDTHQFAQNLKYRGDSDTRRNIYFINILHCLLGSDYVELVRNSKLLPQ